MAGRKIASGALCLLALCGQLHSQEPTKPKQAVPADSNAVANRKEPDPLVQLVRSLTPEQKARLIESIKAWQELTPEVKQALRARDTAFKKNLSEEIETALAGSELSQDQKTTFEKRYKEERRKLDQTLRAEIETRRKAALQEIVGKIKAELSLPNQ
jgi:hypothetical protein